MAIYKVAAPASRDEVFEAHRTKLLRPALGGIDSPAFYPLDPNSGGFAALASAGLTSVRRRPTRDVTARVLVVLVDFPDHEGTTDPKHFEELFFGAAPAARSLRNYFFENSYGRFVIEGSVRGWLRLPEKYSFYVNGEAGCRESSYPRNSQGMVEHALDVLKSESVNWGDFDKDGDGYLDGLVIIHAGTGAELPADGDRFNNMWSHKLNLRHPVVLDGIRAWAYAVCPEDGKIGLCCHEFAHLLGLIDLYDRTQRTYRFGHWCLMSYGNWAGGPLGESPTHLCAWAKAQLGWLDAVSVSKPQQLLLPPIEKSPVAYRLWRKGRRENEYFLLENRQQFAFDSEIPGPGLVIWHVHESRDHNDDPRFPKVCIESARNHDWNDGADRGSPDDPFPGRQNKRKFTTVTEPNSRAQNGAKTGVSVTRITEDGHNIKCSVRV